jgi:putative FmdB family regulatory protein
MPLYEYQCPNDGRFEVIRKFSDPPLTVCPTCGAEVAKLLSAPAIQFKGTGWYITDYARKGGSGEGKKEGGSGQEAGAAKDGGAGKDGGKDAGKGDSAKSESSSTATSTTSSSDSGGTKSSS